MTSRCPRHSLSACPQGAVIAELTAEMKVTQTGGTALVRAERAEPEVVDAALRLMRLLDRPAAVSVLGSNLVREVHY
jgi:hypothetical protein